MIINILKGIVGAGLALVAYCYGHKIGYEKGRKDAKKENKVNIKGIGAVNIDLLDEGKIHWFTYEGKTYVIFSKLQLDSLLATLGISITIGR